MNIEQDVEVIGYDLISVDNAKTLLSDKVFYIEIMEEAVKVCHATLFLHSEMKLSNMN